MYNITSKCVNIYYTRLSGRFGQPSFSTINSCSIFQHFLFDKTKKKFLRIYNFFLVDLQKSTKIKKCFRKLFVILSIHNPSLRSCEVPNKIWAESVQPFWRLLDTKGKTDRKAMWTYIDTHYTWIVQCAQSCTKHTYHDSYRISQPSRVQYIILKKYNWWIIRLIFNLISIVTCHYS